MIRKEVTLIGVGITNLDLMAQIVNEKTRKNNLKSNEPVLPYKYKVNIIPYVMTLDGPVTKYNKKLSEDTGIAPCIKAYSITSTEECDMHTYYGRHCLKKQKIRKDIEDLASKINEVVFEVFKAHIQSLVLMKTLRAFPLIGDEVLKRNVRYKKKLKT